MCVDGDYVYEFESTCVMGIYRQETEVDPSSNMSWYIVDNTYGHTGALVHRDT